ncbi:hypothetical protein FQZ97_1129070 [compost metagenome]
MDQQDLVVSLEKTDHPQQVRVAYQVENLLIKHKIVIPEHHIFKRQGNVVEQ